MYSCEAEHSHELSFPQGAHFSNGEQRQLKANIKLNNMLQLTVTVLGGYPQPHTCLLEKDYWTLYTGSLLCIGSTQQGLG